MRVLFIWCFAVLLVFLPLIVSPSCDSLRFLLVICFDRLLDCRLSSLSLSPPPGPAAAAAFQQGSSQYSKLWKLMLLLLRHASTCIYLFHSVSSSRMQKICQNVSWCSMLRLVSCSAALRSLCGPDELRKKPMPKPQMNSKSLKTGNLVTCEELDWLAKQRPGPPTNLTYPARQWPQSVPTPSKPEPVPQGRSWHCSGWEMGRVLKQKYVRIWQYVISMIPENSQGPTVRPATGFRALLNAGEGPPTLQSTVIPAWNYAPNCKEKSPQLFRTLYRQHENEKAKKTILPNVQNTMRTQVAPMASNCGND